MTMEKLNTQIQNSVCVPDQNRIVVFNNGICKGLNGKIPIGSHKDPILMLVINVCEKKKLKRLIKKEYFENNKQNYPDQVGMDYIIII